MTPEYRRDPLTGGWTILSPSRGTIPRGASVDPPLPQPPGVCPFCPGREALTDVTVARWPEDGDWVVRSVLNKYPMVEPEVPALPSSPPFFEKRAGEGAHEVIIEGREHDVDLPSMAPDMWRASMRMYRDRAAAIRARPGIRHVSVFRNRGRRAGSSQPHPHGQVVGMSVITPDQATRDLVANHYESTAGRDLLTAVVEAERASQRVIVEDARSTLLCPFASRFNGETWVVPRDPTPFTELDDAGCDRFADAVQDAVTRVQRLGREAYNLVWRLRGAAPWHLEVLPRGGPGAGLELASGMHALSLRPEDAAARLR